MKRKKISRKTHVNPVELTERIARKRAWYSRAADFMTHYFGTINFFVINALFFLTWILINTGAIPGITPFDPFPFNFLTMFVSLEAIFLSVIVLISQNKESEIADIRDELDFQINVRAEDEITKILNMLEEIREKMGLPRETDKELLEMEQRTDIEELEREIKTRQN